MEYKVNKLIFTITMVFMCSTAFAVDVTTLKNTDYIRAGRPSGDPDTQLFIDHSDYKAQILDGTVDTLNGVSINDISDWVSPEYWTTANTIRIGFVPDAHSDTTRLANIDTYYAQWDMPLSKEVVPTPEPVVYETGPDFVVNLGDYVWDTTAQSYWTDNNTALDAGATNTWNIYHVLGNHDLGLNGTDDPVAQKNLVTGWMQTDLTANDVPVTLGNVCGEVGVTLEGFYSWDFEGWHFISLDITYDVNGDSDSNNATPYYVPQCELDWLTTDLAANAGEPTIVFSHQWMGTSTVSNDADMEDTDEPRVVEPIGGNAAAVRAILEASGDVKANIAGHYHANAHIRINGIDYYTLNNTGSDFNGDPAGTTTHATMYLNKLTEQVFIEGPEFIGGELNNQDEWGGRRELPVTMGQDFTRFDEDIQFATDIVVGSEICSDVAKTDCATSASIIATSAGTGHQFNISSVVTGTGTTTASATNASVTMNLTADGAYEVVLPKAATQRYPILISTLTGPTTAARYIEINPDDADAVYLSAGGVSTAVAPGASNKVTLDASPSLGQYHTIMCIARTATFWLCSD